MMNEQEYNQFKDFINKLLYEITTIEDYELVISRLGIPAPIKSNPQTWMYKSFCHNIDTHKCKNNLAFYTENRSFYCFSECQVSYNLVTLVEKRFDLIGEKKTRFQCVKWICEQLNIPFNFKEEIQKPNTNLYNWKGLLKYTKKEKENSELKIYDKSILNYFEDCYPQSWIDDYISIDTMKKYGIKYYPYNDSVIIPCLNKDGNMVGIRQRFLNPYGAKYLPLEMLDGMSYEFPVNKTLYGLNYNARNIEHYKKVVIGEAEKFTLQCDSIFSCKNYSVSLYGKSMSNAKLKQLLELGIEEVIIALDFDYKEVGDNKDFNAFKKNVYRIGNFFKPYCKVSSLISYGGHNKNDSPTDHGKDWYLELYNNREELYE